MEKDGCVCLFLFVALFLKMGLLHEHVLTLAKEASVHVHPS